MDKPWIYTQPFSGVYGAYIEKAEKKGRSQDEVNKIIRWLTGYKQNQLAAHLRKETDFENFFGNAPELHANRRLITGVICGIRVEDMDESLDQEIRYLDKMVDELAKGKSMEKILREPV